MFYKAIRDYYICKLQKSLQINRNEVLSVNYEYNTLCYRIIILLCEIIIYDDKKDFMQLVIYMNNYRKELKKYINIDNTNNECEGTLNALLEVLKYATAANF